MNKQHLVVYVKASDLQEFIDILDSKGWSVIDVEPRTKLFLIFASFTLSYTVVCEYVGNPDTYIDEDMDKIQEEIENEIDNN